MVNLKSKKTMIPAIAAIALLTVVFTYSPITALAVSSVNGKDMPQITGSVNVKDEIKNFIKNNQKTTFSQAAATAEKQVTNGSVVGGHIGIVQGYLVYTFCVVDTESNTSYIITIDAGNGNVLNKSDGMQMGDRNGFGPGFFGHEGFGGFEHGKFGHGFGKMMPHDGQDGTDSQTQQSQ